MLILALLLGCPHAEPPATEDAPEQAESVADVATTVERSPALRAELAAIAAVTDEPRTRHRTATGHPIYTNRLAKESSPYLRQHAHNPVDWMPWGDEAFALAKKLGRPVLLSVGYATCHWCHVMEEESFEDPEIATYINANYIAIKVDREERPDVDAIYMAAVHAMRGRGGWPMTVWLTDERKPFYAATYLPARDGDRGTKMGFFTILGKLREAFDQDPERIATTSGDLVLAIQRSLGPTPPGDLPEREDLSYVTESLAKRYDEVNGGTKGSPKFPSTLPVRWLLAEHRRTGDAATLTMATHSLERMAAEGLHDQLGGGFHRYSVDPRWRVPHFEKMLYDNALLTMAYTEAWQSTGNPAFHEVTKRTLAFVDREMSDPAGGFWSAIDADSQIPGTEEKEEGFFYTWTPQEAREVLGPDATAVMAELGIREGGDLDGRTVLHAAKPPTAATAGARAKLLKARALRPRPLTDDKVITGWNGLAISAFARAGLAFGDQPLIDRAERAADFVHRELFADGALHRTFAAGSARHPAVFDDYAFVIAAWLDLFEATGNPVWLTRAQALRTVVDARFADPTGGWFRTPANNGLLAREKPDHDGAIPSGASVHTRSLLRMSAFTSDDALRVQAEGALKAHAKRLEVGGMNELLLAADWRLSRVAEIVVVGPNPGPLLDVVSRHGPAHRVQVAVAESQVERVGKVAPIVADKVARDGKATAYVCEQGACLAPVTEPEALRKTLASWAGSGR